MIDCLLEVFGLLEVSFLNLYEDRLPLQDGASSSAGGLEDPLYTVTLYTMSYTVKAALLNKCCHSATLKSIVAPFTRKSIPGCDVWWLTPTQLAQRSITRAVASLPVSGFFRAIVWPQFSGAGWEACPSVYGVQKATKKSLSGGLMLHLNESPRPARYADAIVPPGL